jgi:hypothetical protein
MVSNTSRCSSPEWRSVTGQNPDVIETHLALNTQRLARTSGTSQIPHGFHECGVSCLDHVRPPLVFPRNTGDDAGLDFRKVPVRPQCTNGREREVMLSLHQRPSPNEQDRRCIPRSSGMSEVQTLHLEIGVLFQTEFRSPRRSSLVLRVVVAGECLGPSWSESRRKEERVK